MFPGSPFVDYRGFLIFVLPFLKYFDIINRGTLRNAPRFFYLGQKRPKFAFSFQSG